jgi:hypothetical protein
MVGKRCQSYLKKVFSAFIQGLREKVIEENLKKEVMATEG